jgi:NAD-dependent dihydropyrimidine dehydrogenase PreA subunit
MGHHGAKENLVPLIDRLNRYPIGLFDNDKLRRILAYLFSEDEAYVASRFPLQESTIGELKRACGMDESRLLPILDGMADKGLVMDMQYGATTYYLLMPGLIGFFEFTFMKQRADLPVAELAKLMTEYLYDDPEQGQAKEFFGSKTQLTRSIPYEEHVPVSSVVTSYESAREIIKQASFGAVGQCYCRHKKEHLDESCDKEAPVENICISLGTAAKFMARRGFAEQRTTEELLQVIDTARGYNLTHITDNIRHNPSFICNCCSCCCELLGGVQQGFPNGIAKANYTLQVDEHSCVGCGLCVKACNVKALGLTSRKKGDAEPSETKKKRGLIIDAELCLGCGACISTCATESLSLVPCDRPATPEKKKDLFVQILKEKKRFTPFLLSGMKTKVLRRLGIK